jgi:hypothetical protein
MDGLLCGLPVNNPMAMGSSGWLGVGCTNGGCFAAGCQPPLFDSTQQC